MEERCRLDIYHPKKIDHLPTVIWFHGGGLIGGNKFIPDQMKKLGNSSSGCKLSTESQCDMSGLH